MPIPGDSALVVGDRETNQAESSGARLNGAPPAPEDGAFGSLLSPVPADIRDVSFKTAVRGYERREVDAYVERVNGVIAELEISRSPQSAIKHALDRVGEQTSGVLQRAREVAEELTQTALTEADHATRRAKVEAEETIETAQMRAHELRGQSKDEADQIVARAAAAAAERVKQAEGQVRALQAEAERRLRTLRADIKAAGDARRRLLDELRSSAEELEEFAGGMLARLEDEPTARLEDEPTAGHDQDALTETLPTEAIARASGGGGRARVERKGGSSGSANSQRGGDRADPTEQVRPRAAKG
jgi:DivIVA domain-containing protein